MRRLAVLVATGFGIGHLPVAPATWASAVVAVTLFALLPRIGLPALGLLLLAATPIAIFVSGLAERELGKDAHPIVVDEVVGMLVTVFAVPLPRGGGRLCLLLVAAFLLFRFFDIVKPFPVRQSQALPGGYGVVVDDLLAGLYANVALQILARLWLRGSGS